MSRQPTHDKVASESSSGLTGKTIGRFLIRSRLGAGGMGEVYLAEDTGLKRCVALKRIAAAHRSDESSRQRLWREAQLASRLNDPHIASVFDVIEENGQIFVVMEYIEGETLRHRLKRPISIEEFFAIGTQCAAALKSAHAAGLLHRDIKPENIMLTIEGGVKVLDFGVSRPLPGSEAATTRDSLEKAGFSGTLAYMAPEVLEQKEADSRADIFSLGAVFYEMLSGKNPFRRAGFLETCNAILHEDPPPLREKNPEVTADIEHIVANMITKNPEQRCAAAADLMAELRALAENHPHASQFVNQPRARRGGARALRALVALGSVLVVALAGGSYWTYRQRQRTAEASATAGVRRIHSITILPFRKIGGPGEYDYFGSGLADVLSAKLTNARLLEVHSPPATINLADPRLDPLGVGQGMKVDAILSGSYQIEGATLSFSYTLLDVRNNVQIAGNAYTRPFTEAIEVEHLVASEIVDSLRASTDADQRARFTAPLTQQADAFQAYLRSNYEMERFWQQPSEQQLAAAEKPLQDALRLDPRFTLALVSLARLHWTAVFWGYAKGPEVLAEAAQEVGRAIQADPGLGEAYAARALVEFQQGKLDSAEGSLREAFSRSPNSALAYYAAGLYFLGRGLPDRSTEAFHRARDLDPQMVRRELTFAYRYSGNAEQAEEQARQDLKEHPQDLANEAALAHALATRGKLPEVRKLELDLLRRAPDDPYVRSVAALLSVLEGTPFSIHDWLNRYEKTYWSDGGYCVNVAEVLAVAKQNKQAMRWLRRSGELSMRNYPFLAHNPLYKNLQSDPDFKSYLESVRVEWEAANRREAEDPLLPSARA